MYIPYYQIINQPIESTIVVRPQSHVSSMIPYGAWNGRRYVQCVYATYAQP